MKERGRVQEVEKVEIGGEKRWPSGLVAGRENGPQSSVLIFPSQSVQYIQGAKRRCRSVNGRFHLKSRSLGSDKGIITRAPGSGESEHAVADT